MTARLLPVAAGALALAVVQLALGSHARAGSGPASLACAALPARGTSGPAAPALTLKGLVPATEDTLDLTLTLGAATLKLSSAGGDRALVLDAFADRVFTLSVLRKDGSRLRLYALPGTIKSRTAPYALHARFQAMLLEAPRPAAQEKADPGPAGSAVLRKVKLTCQYDYEV